MFASKAPNKAEELLVDALWVPFISKGSEVIGGNLQVQTVFNYVYMIACRLESIPRLDIYECKKPDEGKQYHTKPAQSIPTTPKV